jgi:hypothetical protein
VSYQLEGEFGSAVGAFLTKISQNMPMNFAIFVRPSVRNSRTAERMFVTFAVGEDLNFVEVIIADRLFILEIMEE